MLLQNIRETKIWRLDKISIVAKNYIQRSNKQAYKKAILQSESPTNSNSNNEIKRDDGFHQKIADTLGDISIRNIGIERNT